MRNADLLDGPDVRGVDGDEEDFAEFSSGDPDDAASVVGQDANLRS